MNCRKVRSLFTDALYNHLSEEYKNIYYAHLKKCTRCANAFNQFASTLKVMDNRHLPKPDPVFWTGYWDRLAPKLGELKEKRKRARDFRFLLYFPRWSYQLSAAVVMLVIGVFLGKWFFTSDRQQIIHPDQKRGFSGTMINMDKNAYEYIQKSKVLILGLVNFDSETEDPYVLDLPYQKQLSQDLIKQAGGIKERLDQPEQQRLKDLISDLEIILLQIANMENGNNLEMIEMVRNGVDRRGVLLRINLEEMRIGESDDSAPEKKDSIAI